MKFLIWGTPDSSIFFESHFTKINLLQSAANFWRVDSFLFSSLVNTRGLTSVSSADTRPCENIKHFKSSADNSAGLKLLQSFFTDAAKVRKSCWLSLTVFRHFQRLWNKVVFFFFTTPLFTFYVENISLAPVKSLERLIVLLYVFKCFNQVADCTLGIYHVFSEILKQFNEFTSNSSKCFCCSSVFCSVNGWNSNCCLCSSITNFFWISSNFCCWSKLAFNNWMIVF